MNKPRRPLDDPRLFGRITSQHMFDGDTIEPEADNLRLKTLQERVFAIMSSGDWYTLSTLAARTGGAEASVSARLRDLRKPRWGEHTVVRDRYGDGIYRYRLIPNGPLLDGSGPQSPKAEARKRITAYLTEWETGFVVHSGVFHPDIITAFNGVNLLASDIREMLR